MSLISIQLFFISLLSFLLPTQLGFHIDTFSSSVYGFVVDYLTPTVYLTDILALLVIVFGFKKNWFNKKNFILIFLFLIFVLSNVLISDYKLPSIYKWVRVTEMVALAFVLINTKTVDFFKHILRPLSYSMFISSLLGVLQYINKGSIGGFFYWLGERTLRFSDPNVSPYPYSTFSHSNSFAGFLLVFGIFLLQYKNKFNQKFFWTLFILVVINIVLTNSLNVYLAIIFLFILNFRNNLSFMFLSFDLLSRSFTHRMELIKASMLMVKENFLLGVGLNNFIPNLPKFSNSFVNAWELQPVHNIFLLAVSETGIIGFIFLIFLIINTLAITNLPLLAIIFTGMSDHYWLTLQQNMLLLVIVLSISLKYKHNKS